MGGYYFSYCRYSWHEGDYCIQAMKEEASNFSFGGVFNFMAILDCNNYYYYFFYPYSAIMVVKNGGEANADNSNVIYTTTIIIDNCNEEEIVYLFIANDCYVHEDKNVMVD